MRKQILHFFFPPQTNKLWHHWSAFIKSLINNSSPHLLVDPQMASRVNFLNTRWHICSSLSPATHFSVAALLCFFCGASFLSPGRFLAASAGGKRRARVSSSPRAERAGAGQQWRWRRGVELWPRFLLRSLSWRTEKILLIHLAESFLLSCLQWHGETVGQWERRKRDFRF